MLQITADIYSGRPNPSWIIEDSQEVAGVLREMGKSRDAIAAAPAQAGGLGELRGFLVDVQNDELAQDHGFASSQYVSLDAASANGTLHQLADRLVALAKPGQAGTLQDGEAADAGVLQDFLNRKFSRESGITESDSNRPGGVPEAQDDPEAAVQETAAVTCMVESAAYNPGFWNNDATVRSRNNCYNYASNKRTNTFAQPGRGSGQIYTAITCPAVTLAALRDGLHRRFVCFPDAEKPRYLVALVVAPGPGFVDFHWYRRNKEGFWSHKPGGTAARNVDNSGKIITDPATCNRGPYTQFCGYFYTCRSQRIN